MLKIVIICCLGAAVVLEIEALGILSKGVGSVDIPHIVDKMNVSWLVSTLSVPAQMTDRYAGRESNRGPLRDRQIHKSPPHPGLCCAKPFVGLAIGVCVSFSASL